jgi:alkylation response protein AidB-like acyl-CoA dehydrogenase
LGANRLGSGVVAKGRTASEALAEAAEYNQTYVWYPQRAGRPDLAASQARDTGTSGDPVVRQAVAALSAQERTARWNVERARAARARGGPPGPEGSVAKLSGSEIARASARVHAQMAGAHAMLSGPDSPLGGVIAEIIVSVPAGSIAGGTDEIQHNIIGERVLGLPKEPSVDVDVPFREVRTNRR